MSIYGKQPQYTLSPLAEDWNASFKTLVLAAFPAPHASPQNVPVAIVISIVYHIAMIADEQSLPYSYVVGRTALMRGDTGPIFMDHLNINTGKL